ncbi:MAG: hypothetical protein AB8H79_02420 [Myxococcota bacterium]
MANDLSRRQTLIGLAAVGLVGCTGDVGSPTDSDSDTDVDTDVDTDTDTDVVDPDCDELTKEQVEGPFYPGEPEVRQDIRETRNGVRLDLDLQVVAQGSCEAIAGAEVDVWAADATGAYSGYAEFDSVGESWLRGQQVTGADGVARFTVVVPGAYPGRAVHLHVKVRAPGRDELTTQVYLPDAVVERVLDRIEYVNSSAQTTLPQDDFYEGDTLLEVTLDDEDVIAAQGQLVV